MLTRRDLAKGSIATAALPFLPRPARADPGIRAVLLDGQSDIFCPSPGKLGFPSSSGKVTATYCYAGTHPPNPKIGNNNPISMIAVGNDDSAFVVSHAYDSPGKIRLDAIIIVGITSGAPKLFRHLTAPVLPYDGSFPQIVVGLDAMAKKSTALINGESWPNTYPAEYQSSVAMPWGSADSVHVGGYVSGKPPPPNMGHRGELAEVWLNVGADIDLTDPKVVAGLWDAKHGVPVRQSADGQSFFLTSRNVVKPNFYLSGGKGEFNDDNAHMDWGFMAAKTKNPWTYNGRVVTADIDPWNAPPSTAVSKATLTAPRR